MVELPEPWTGASFEAKARELGVNLFGAERFIVGGADVPRALRLSLTGTATREELRKGLEKINDMLEGEYSEIVPIL